MKNVFGRILPAVAGFCLLCFVFTASSFAQDLDDVTISGKIIDSNGLAIVGATVTATFTEMEVERKAITDKNGRYRIIELQPGTYSVKAEQTGFGAKIKSELETISGQTVQLDFRLDPGDVVVDPIEVTGEDAPTIDITRTVVGGTITQREIEELPNTSNDVLDLVFTLGGVTEEPFSIRNLADDRIGGGTERDQPSEVTGAGNFSLSGGAAYSTNITIDGLDNNDDRAAEERFQPPPDSVAEVQVIANQFSAEYGRASGGRINIRTRAGARKFRGRAFLFFEDDNLNANSFNNNRRIPSLSRLPFTEYNPGGNLSGPIPFGYFKNKTYFFSSYSYQDRNATSQILSALPVDQNPLYPLPLPTNPSDRRVDDIPGPNDTFPRVEIATYAAQVATPTRRHRFTQRIDHNFTDTHNITFNYQIGRSNNFRQYRETTRFLEETLQGRVRNNDSFYITDNFVFSPNLVNQFRFQFSNYRPDFATDGSQDPVVLLFISDDSRDNSPDQNRGTVVVGNSTSNFASLREETRYQFQETLNYIRGNQTFRLGFDVQAIESDNVDLSDATGTFNFVRVADFLSNQVSRYRRNFGANSVQKNTYYGLFFQDDWRYKPNLTLSFGLRYERETLSGDKNNFGPRLALAYSPDKSGKSVIRVGGGIFYNRTLLRTLDDYSLGRSTTFFDSETLDGPSSEARCLNSPSAADAARDKCRFLVALGQQFPNPPDLEGLRSLLSSLNITDGGFVNSTNFTRLIEPGINIPESYQFNIGYERDLGNGFAFETNYTYNKAARLWRETNINAFEVPKGFNNFTGYLVSLGSVDIDGTMTTFVLGDPTESVGTFDPDRTGDNTSCRSSSTTCIVNLRTLNSSEGQNDPITRALAALDTTLIRPYNNDLDQVEQVSSIGQSVYHGLQFELRRRFRSLGYGFGGSFRFVYTLSKTQDDGFVDTSSALIAGDFRNEFSDSSIDRRHRFRFSGSMELPNWAGKLRLSPILRIESGKPFNISIGGRDRNLDDVGNDRPNYSGDLSDIVSRKEEDPLSQTFVDRFSLAPIGTTGNLPRNAGRGPKLFSFDLNISRQFKFTDRFKIRPQISFDNIFNTTTFSFGSDFINLANADTSEFARGFLVPSRTLRSRQIQLGIRFDF